jgi:hypothetical protein
VSRLLHRVWPAVSVDLESLIIAALIGLSAYGFYKLSALIL